MCICCCSDPARKSSLSTTFLYCCGYIFIRRLRRQRVSLLVYEAKDISSYNRITPLLQFFFCIFLYLPAWRIRIWQEIQPHEHTFPRNSFKKYSCFSQQQQHLVLLLLFCVMSSSSSILLFCYTQKSLCSLREFKRKNSQLLIIDHVYGCVCVCVYEE